jgi:hypothetical protein
MVCAPTHARYRCHRSSFRSLALARTRIHLFSPFLNFLRAAAVCGCDIAAGGLITNALSSSHERSVSDEIKKKKKKIKPLLLLLLLLVFAQGNRIFILQCININARCIIIINIYYFRRTYGCCSCYSRPSTFRRIECHPSCPYGSRSPNRVIASIRCNVHTRARTHSHLPRGCYRLSDFFYSLFFFFFFNLFFFPRQCYEFDSVKALFCTSKRVPFAHAHTRVHSLAYSRPFSIVYFCSFVFFPLTP